MRTLPIAIVAWGLISVLPTSPLAQQVSPPPYTVPSPRMQAVPTDAPLTQCDTYAANPFDPQRKAVGVPREKLSPALAIPACKSALAKFPTSPRLMYQLGRSYHYAGNVGEALTYYRQAAQYNYVTAETVLGELSQHGWGVPQNYGEAIVWYKKAASKEYAPAQNSLVSVAKCKLARENKAFYASRGQCFCLTCTCAQCHTTT